MILDKGICSVFHRTDSAENGSMPAYSYTHLVSGWYAELSYDTVPIWQTQGRKEQRADARIRILQCRDIAQNDVVVLENAAAWKDVSSGATVYRVIRAWHGPDDDSPELISDLTLEVVKP